jgi:hypothetical protein
VKSLLKGKNCQMCEAPVSALDRTTSAIERNHKQSMPVLEHGKQRSNTYAIERTPRRPCFTCRPSRHRFMPSLWNSRAVTRARSHTSRSSAAYAIERSLCDRAHLT